MPNWCETAYVIEGKKETLSLIKDTIEGLMCGTIEKIKDSDCTWEGNILHALGIEFNESTQHLRGFINETPRIVDGLLLLNADEAWSVTDFRKKLRELFPDIKIYWMATEPDLEYYKTNDAEGKWFKFRYSVEVCINEEHQFEDFMTEEEVYSFLSENYGVSNLDEVKAAFNGNPDNDDYIHVAKYDVIND